MYDDVTYKDSELEVHYQEFEEDSFQEDFGCGMETCYPHGRGNYIELESVLVLGRIDILGFLTQDEIDDIKELINY